MRPLHGLAAGALVLAAAVAPAILRAQAVKQPVYVGSSACAQCHDGKAAGNQYSHWLLSAHAKGWATLATPEAKAMARLSGLSGDPQKAPICLGCHATASDAEPWEKDPAFRIEDGVQCEKCHGPGSEYMDERVMRDPDAARRAGLRRFTTRDCAVCHYVKGSHAAVLRRPQLDVDAAWRALAHRIPEGGRGRTLPAAATIDTRTKDAGAHACGACHQGPQMGDQFSLWQMSPHARAYAVLSTPAAGEVARRMGVDGDPQQASACLRCHVTGGGAASSTGRTYDPAEGVGCESCHAGNGERVSPEAESSRPDPSHVPLRQVTERTCARVPHRPACEAAGLRGGEGANRAPDQARAGRGQRRQSTPPSRRRRPA